MKSLKKHYHWVIAALVFLEMVIFGGLINSASIFTLPISQSLGISTTTYSVAMMPYTLVCFAGTCLTGFLFSRFGYKKVAVFSLLLTAVSLMLTAISQSVWIFCLSKILFGMAYGTCFTAGSVRIIKDWFWKHQGLVLGAVNMSTGIGGSLMTILLTAIIHQKDWRAACWAAAIIVAGIAVLYVLIKDRPDQIGARPYGFGTKLTVKKTASSANAHWPGFSMAEQLKRPAFYLMCTCVLVSCTCIYMASSFMIPHFRSLGFTGGEAATYQSVYMLILAVVKLAAGFFYDRFGAKPVMLVCMSCAIGGQLMMGLTSDPTLCFVAVAIFAVGLCMTSLMVPLLAMPLFGYEAYQGVGGIFLGLCSLSSLFSNPLSSLCYDTTGTYGLGFRIAAVVNVGVLVLYCVLFVISKKEQARYYALHPKQPSLDA